MAVSRAEEPSAAGMSKADGGRPDASNSHSAAEFSQDKFEENDEFEGPTSDCGFWGNPARLSMPFPDALNCHNFVLSSGPSSEC